MLYRSLCHKVCYSTRTVVKNPKLADIYATLPENELLPNGFPDYMKLILNSAVYDAIKPTPMSPADNLTKMVGAKIMLKREDLSPVFSFKLRGAYNMISKLSREQKQKGVIAYSAGNHAQGVAFASRDMGIPATIVMPKGSSPLKYNNVVRMGAQVILHGDDFDAARAECERLCVERGLTAIPAFDHPYIIAGQGSVGVEILNQVRNADIVFVPVGGGGLISGIGAYLKRIAPHIKLIGVESYEAATLWESVQHNENHLLSKVGNFADGTSIRILGEESYRMCREYVDDVIRVNTDEICAAVKDIFEDTRALVEPSGALSVAGMKRYVQNHPEIDHASKTYVPVLSGSNINFDRLRFVSERAVLGGGKEVSLLVTVPFVPGSLKKLQSIINPRSMTEFKCRYNGGPVDHVFISFTVNERDEELSQVTKDMEAAGFKVMDVSENEMAKSHGRHLVGGIVEIENERIFSFEFPERPGELTNFFDGLKFNWDLTLFHYRNQGSDIGKVLAGISVPPADNEKFDAFMKTLGYPHKEETENPVYSVLLKQARQ